MPQTASERRRFRRRRRRLRPVGPAARRRLAIGVATLALALALLALVGSSIRAAVGVRRNLEALVVTTLYLPVVRR